MDIAEQAADKVVGWAAGSLVKHYLDLPPISGGGRELRDRKAPCRVEDVRLGPSAAE